MVTTCLVWATTTSAWSDRVHIEYKTVSQKDARLARSLSLFVPKGEPASSFLYAGPFDAKLTSMLRIHARQDVIFELRGNGSAELQINGQKILDALETPSTPVTLSEGKHDVKILFRSKRDEAASLRVFWKTDAFDFEPIPSSALTKPEITLDQTLRTARNTIAQQKCIAC
ncbi:hypothetical protein OAM01_01075, partial [bacterium]|nr:hypothetical protein [bacterium]